MASIKMASAMASANHFDVLALNSESVDASNAFVIPKKGFVPKKAVVPKNAFVIPEKAFTPKKVVVLKKVDISVIPDIQSQYPLTMTCWSGSTNNEFVIGKTKISPTLGLKKDATLLDLNEKINQMEGIPYDCLVWSENINTPELKKMIENQYPLPAEYQHLHDLLCDGTIKSTKCQKVLIIDFRRPHLKGCQYTYLKNHQQLFFGSARESYLNRKSEVNGLKKYYDNFCRHFNFSEVEKVISECHKFALTVNDSDWIKYRENQLRLLKNAVSVFELSDAKIFERFPSFEDLKTEIDKAFLYKNELIEMLPKLKLEYDRKMIAQEVRDPEAFPSL